MSITIMHQSDEKYLTKQEFKEGLNDLFGLLPESFGYDEFIDTLDEACQKWSGDTIEDMLLSG